MAKTTANKIVSNFTEEQIAAARAAWLQEQNDSYHAQFGGNEASDLDEHFYAACTLSYDGEREVGISISTADFW